MKKQRRIIATGVLGGITVCGLIQAAHSYDLLLTIPSILAGKKKGQENGWQPLNDTGITWSGNYTSGKNETCISFGDNVVAAQDCSHGRDVSRNNDSDGHAGFSFTKLGSDGLPLDDQNADYATDPWACVKDNVTGLIWEVKTNDGKLHNRDDRYTWYNTDQETNGGAVGSDDQGGDTCHGYRSGVATTYCNTQEYVNRVNADYWCRASDWRMPTRKELESLVVYNYAGRTIDTGYFPNAVNSNSWSGTPHATNTASAWKVDFFYGSSKYEPRSSSYAVRLVRDGRD